MQKIAKPKTRTIRSNAGIRANYETRLLKLIDEMQNSVLYWLKASYKQNPPEVLKLAQDTSVDEIKKQMGELIQRWTKRFNTLAPRLARYFATSVQSRTTDNLRTILRNGGISVKFQMGKAAQDALEAIVAENVSLIKSIPQQYLTQVEGMVMRSVAAGRELHILSKELEDNFYVTRNRARLIARDQNNKATANILRIRQIEAGIEEAVWMHSHAGRQPRPSHVANNGKKYNIKTGWYDPAVKQYIWPGQLINCRCGSRPIVTGFD